MKEITIYLTNYEDYSIIRLRRESMINSTLIGDLTTNDLLQILQQSFVFCEIDSDPTYETKFIVNTRNIAKISFK